MRIKTFLIMVLSLASLTAFAQGGGVKGKVVSRTTRAAIDGVKVTLTPGDITTTTDATGNFEIDKLAKGEYSLTFEATEFESLTIAVRVDQMMRDINLVIMVPSHYLHHCPHQKMFSITSHLINSVRCASMSVVTIHNIRMSI